MLETVIIKLSHTYSFAYPWTKLKLWNKVEQSSHKMLCLFFYSFFNGNQQGKIWVNPTNLKEQKRSWKSLLNIWNPQNKFWVHMSRLQVIKTHKSYPQFSQVFRLKCITQNHIMKHKLPWACILSNFFTT